MEKANAASVKKRDVMSAIQTIISHFALDGGDVVGVSVSAQAVDVRTWDSIKE